MTATLNPEGHIILPPEANAAAHAHEAEEFHVLISSSGVITLRPKNRPRMSLVEHLRGMKGLEINPRRDPIPPPIAL